MNRSWTLFFMESLPKNLPFDVFMDLIGSSAKSELSPAEIRAIRRSVATSRREFERLTQIPARTVEAYEQGRRKPDAATRALFLIFAREPKAAIRALSTDPGWSF